MSSPRSLFLVGVLLGAGIVTGGRLMVGPGSAPPCEVSVAHPDWSAARQWNEALLEAIRHDLPAPTVHARNLFHASVAMWDAWAAFDPTAEGYLTDEEYAGADDPGAREEAVSYAAYRVLSHRYATSVGASDTLPSLDRLMTEMCLPIETTTTTGDSPAALGNRIAAAVVAFGLTDGANEAQGYDAPDYEPVNPPLVVAEPGTEMVDPNRWQPLQLEEMISQNGIPVTDSVQQFIGADWGGVAGFALPDGGEPGLPIAPGEPPRLGDPASEHEFKEAVVEVLRYSSLLDPAQDATIDISPGAIGNNPLGTNDGDGWPENPTTGEPYAGNAVRHADFGRAVAEFWADGPHSETPPGHWNVLANEVSDTLAPDLRIGGGGPVVDRLEWDVKLYLALNGANHDAAVAAWGAKGHYDYARPISMIRHLGGLGQSSDPDGPAFHPDGLPLVPDLIEVVTEETTAPGGRHRSLGGHEGEVAVRAWTGVPEDRETATGGVGWILAVDWVPYQLPTFVTPAFAGYVSGHSAFSRASAEVMEAFTGSAWFPGGLGEWRVPAGSFEFEAGPAEDVVLQWATYADAADQAGLSRLYGGIHVRADDLAGRRIGAICGQSAWDEVQRYYGSGGHADA